MSSSYILMDAMDYAEDRYLKKYFEMRQNCSQKEKVIHFINAKSVAAATAAIALLLCGLFAGMPSPKENPVIATKPNATESLPPQATQETEDTTAPTVTETSPPDFFHAYAAPSLEELYSIAPYSELLPQKVLANCVFKGSYMPVYDPIVAAVSGPSYSPDDFPNYLSLRYSMGDAQWNGLNISVCRYEGDGQCTDPYDLAAYELQRVGDICKGYKRVLCGDYVVSYAYTGPEITVEEFREMVLSAKWFA